MPLDSFVHRLCTEGKNFGSIATVMADGSPQVSFVWVDSDGEYILINTAEGRLKAKNLRSNPRVAIAIANSENPYEQAMVRGRIVEDTNEGASEHINTLSQKYLGLKEYPYSGTGEVRVIFKIKPEKVLEVHD